MKAVAYNQPGPIESNNLQDITIDTPKPTGRDLLVEIKAISVNPVDTKLRRNVPRESSEWKILGFDASGVVHSIGELVEDFKPGDEVYYAGALDRPGTNCEFHLVDERIVGNKPTSLSYAEAAALPLTSITAWELLFDRLKVQEPTPQGQELCLVIGGAGGVGSITIQLLSELTDLTIIATASRPETKSWVAECGAHHVINHREPIAAQVEKLGLGAPGFVVSTNQSNQHYLDIAELIAPQGRFGIIDDPDILNPMALKMKSVSIHWEFMFTRSMYGTPDISEQAKLLNKVADLVDAGKIQSTLTQVAGKINAKNLTEVHARIEKSSTHGKIVLEGF